MNKVKALLNPELANFIKQNFPVVKKRSALWFFSNELKNNLTFPTTAITRPRSSDLINSHVIDDKNQDQSSSSTQTSHTNRPTSGNGTKLSRNKILQMWKNMDPESKRKYFNMAEFDELRFEEQKSQWVSEVGGLIHKYGALEQVSEMAPSHKRLQDKFLTSLERLQKSYEQMIQTESTKMIYKDAIKRVGGTTSTLDPDRLISSVPRHHRAILTKPRRPPPAFVLYLNDNMDRYKRIRVKTKTKDSCMRICADEWNDLDEDTRQVYEDRYDKLKEEYDKAMESYRLELFASNDNYLQSASREKKAFKRSLRRRLRKSSVLPVSIRNAFNFFVMDNKDAKLADLTQIWRDMPAEEKLKYVKMNQEDVIRYQREIETYNEMRKTLSEIVSGRRSKSESDIK